SLLQLASGSWSEPCALAGSRAGDLVGVTVVGWRWRVAGARNAAPDRVGFDLVCRPLLVQSGAAAVVEDHAAGHLVPAELHLTLAAGNHGGAGKRVGGAGWRTVVASVADQHVLGAAVHAHRAVHGAAADRQGQAAGGGDGAVQLRIADRDGRAGADRDAAVDRRVGDAGGSTGQVEAAGLGARQRSGTPHSLVQGRGAVQEEVVSAVPGRDRVLADLQDRRRQYAVAGGVQATST